jgi:hypothetical protein
MGVHVHAVDLCHDDAMGDGQAKAFNVLSCWAA